MSEGKVKYYKNPARNTVDNTSDRQPYVPQYQLMGVTPEAKDSKPFPDNVLIVRAGSSDDDNPRTRRPSIRQPYAEPIETNPQLKNGQLPNVGNNMEQSWSYIDGEIVDDISGEVIGKLDPKEPLIDNNDIVTIPGETQEATPQDEPLIQKSFMTEEDLKEVINDANNLSKLSDDSYILIVSGTIVSIGTMESIQAEVSSLVFGENPLCDNNPIPIEDIVILKKVKIKVGLFLE